MSKPPATPDKPGKQVVEPSPKSAQASTEKLTSTTKVKQVSRHEPSPASTYGDTTAGSSVPATPEDVGSLGTFRFLGFVVLTHSSSDSCCGLDIYITSFLQGGIV